MEPSQPFEVQSYIGSDIAQMGYENERPPASAELVVELQMGADGDYRTYLLSAHPEPSGWILWQMGHDFDSDEPLFCRVAFGQPGQGYPAKMAAEKLLTQVWDDELVLEGFLLSGNIFVEKAGLLGAEDVKRIQSIVFGD